MKNECYIVRDLLPSYIDQLCSDESKQFIEQHMAHCESCSHMLYQMKEELNVVEQRDLPLRMEQKKPFEKVSRFLKAQLDFTKFLKVSFGLSLLITLILLVFAFTNLAEWQENQQEQQRVEQEQQDIMDKTFAAILAQGMPDEAALQSVFEQYQEQLEHIALFASEDTENTPTWQQGPMTTFPVDYKKALIVVGENGNMTEAIVPNDYDIGTMVMANEEWVVQFEYKESYLPTVENAHQIKHYFPTVWQLFSMPTVFTIITLFIFTIWLYQKRIMKPMETTIG
ncbi:hypothetical protein HNQ44_001851 [Planomicrobium koreense]|uniref:Putative zinc-finger domain-containing protein n=1 Tax=Planococcus koreensis TaxID=112331 RepID=A0A7W8CTW3_9BACL|nr:zf-HC2 domain-containing protein [Planococcus koreensis]MBB5180423.1 hypothetical protein [Planococcus koreensis]